MTKVVITAAVEDKAAWEAGFRTHRDLFAEFGFATLYEYAINDDSTVAVCADVNDVAGFVASLETPKNLDAMKHDGVKGDTVQVFVLNKGLKI